ncbi:hypothetical protein DL93DRAFT_2174529 [Clavulina sp. PMI_390]|nr:hypothetical protein DL93DRAFT_2174529 [Clavulina sp. PMI_390]
MKVAWISALSLAIANAVFALPVVQQPGLTGKRAEEINPDITIYYREEGSSGTLEKRAEEIARHCH